MTTKLLDAAAWPFYAIGKLYGYTLRVFHWAALAVQIGIEEGRGDVLQGADIHE